MARIQKAGLAIVLTLSACSANWQPVSVAQPRSMNERIVLEFHAGGQLVRLHAVRIMRDSVSGIPWLGHTSCDTCRVSYALAGISLPRTGNPGAGAWAIMAPAGLGLLLLTGLWIALSHNST